MSTALDELRNVAKFIDYQFHPQLAEIPALFSALVHKLEHGDKLSEVIDQAKKDAEQLGAQAVGNEVHEAVSGLLVPTPESPEDQHLAELAKMRSEQEALLERLRADQAELRKQLDATAPPVPEQPAEPERPPVSGGSPEFDELAQLREVAQRQAIELAQLRTAAANAMTQESGS